MYDICGPPFRSAIVVPPFNEICSRSMPIDPDECSMCSNVLSLHACRSKYISGAQNCAVTRRLSLQMQLRYTKMHSGSTPVSPNACFMCSNVLSLDTCRSKRIASSEIHLPRFVTFLFVDLHPFGTFLFGPERPEVFVLDAILEAGKRKK